MNKKLLFLLLVPMLALAQKEGQPLIDSLLVELPKAKADSVKVYIMNRLSFSYKFSDDKLCLSYVQQALSLSEKIKYKKGLISSYGNLAIYYTIHSQYDKAKSCYEKQLALTTDSAVKSDVYTNIAVLYLYQSNYAKALEYNNMSLAIDEKADNLAGQALTLGNIGDIYFEIHSTEKAIRYYGKSLAINEKLGLKDGIATMTYNLGQCYAELKQPNKAIMFFNKALAINQEINNIAIKAACYDGLSQIYLEQKAYEKSISFSKISLELNKQINDPNGLSSNYSNLGNAYKGLALLENNPVRKKELFAVATTNYNQSLALEKEINDLKRISEGYLSLSEIQKAEGKYKEALVSYEMGAVYKDSVFNTDQKETLKNLEDKREIDLKIREIEISKIRLREKEKEKWLLLSGIVFSLIIGGLLFYQSRNRKKLNEKLDRANHLKNRFIGILNHDLRSPIHRFIHLLQLQQEDPELLNEESKARIREDIMVSAVNLLNTMEDVLLWSKNHMVNFEPQLKKIEVADLFADTQKHFAYTDDVKISFENPENIKLFTDENYIKTIIRNLTANSAKALEQQQNPTILWKAWQEEDQSYLCITDNGSGALPDQFKILFDEKSTVGTEMGLGLHLIRDLAKAIDCRIVVDSKPNVGTSITLSFKN